MSIARWDPVLGLKNLEDRMSRRLSRTIPSTEENTMSTFEFAPPVDVYEDEKKITLKMELPGIKQEDLSIRIDGNTLSISGERRFEKEEKQENFRRIERQYGSFSRLFELPSSADRDTITANFQDGILQVELPKKAEAQGKQIPIGTGVAQLSGSSKEKTKAA